MEKKNKKIGLDLAHNSVREAQAQSIYKLLLGVKYVALERAFNNI